MLSSVNCDDYFEWHGFVRPSVKDKAVDGEKAGQQQQQQQKRASHHLPTELRRQRHRKSTAKVGSKRAEDLFTVLNKSFEYRSHGEIDTLASEEPVVGSRDRGTADPSEETMQQDGGGCVMSDLYADPMDATSGGGDYCMLPPSAPGPRRRLPLKERSNLPPWAVKLRSLSLSPLRKAFKSLAVDRENSGKIK